MFRRFLRSDIRGQRVEAAFGLHDFAGIDGAD
jgi:hypothetical protein